MEKDKKDGLESILIDLKKFSIDIEQGTENINSIEDKFEDALKKVQVILESDQSSREFKLFNNWRNENAGSIIYRSVPRVGEKVAPKHKEKISILMEIIEKMLNSSSKKEISFNKEEEFQALTYVRKLIKSASEKVIIIDGYLNDVVFDLISDIDKNTNVFMLTKDTGHTINIFRRLFPTFSKSHPNVSAKINNASHDRYIIVDDKFFYHMGASINTIGKGDFMINEIETEAEKKRKMEDFNNWWNSGQEIN